ncbi:MAG TPA: CHAT domain-containing protein [Candidatus Limnocylindrales bacterium]
MRIVLTHGRDQAFQVAATMERPWDEALRDGLHAIGYPQAADVPIDFAFYGDIWRPDRRELADARGGGDERERDTERGDGDGERGAADLSRTLAEPPSALAAGIASEMLPADLERLEFLDWNTLAKVIDTLDEVFHVDRLVLTWFLKDLDEYFRDPTIRDRVLNAVRVKIREANQSGERVLLLGHSMGTIVGYDLLATDGAASLNVGGLVTFGSPLGMASLRANVAKLHPGTPYPEDLAGWTNVYNEKDFATVVRELANLYPASDGPRISDVQAVGRDPSLLDPGRGHDPIVYLSSVGLAKAVAGLLDAEAQATALAGGPAGAEPEEPIARGIEDALGGDRGASGADESAPERGRAVRNTGTPQREREVARAVRRAAPRPARPEPERGDATGTSRAEPPPAPGEAAPTAPSVEAAATNGHAAADGAAPGTRTVQRTASADFPPVVSPGSTHDLLVAISGEAIFARETGVAITAPVDTRFIDLRVGVYAADFDVAAADDPRRTFAPLTVDLDDAGAVAKAGFRLTAHKADQRRDTEIYVTIYRGNLPIGQLHLITAIDPIGDVRSAPLTIGTASAPDPDFVLVVTDRSPAPKGAGPFDISASKESRYLNSPLGSFPVAVNAWQYAQKRLDGFRHVKDEPTPADMIRKAEDLGNELWWDLPEDFRAFYWTELHDQDVSIAIYSQEPYIPWELVKPQREPGGGEQAEFLGVSFRMARWKQALPFPDPLTVSGFSVIAPIYVPPLPGAQQEAKDLVDEFGATMLPGDRAAVRAFLESNQGVQLIHFAGHGEYDAASTDDTVIRLSDLPLVPSDLNRATLGRSSRPLVFLNACEVGEQGWALTRIGGWAEAFTDVGFSGFVGPYWAVNDRVARKAANLFYSSLADGETVGEAVREIRRHFYSDPEDQGHPSWLAYTLHCQPNVHVRMQRAGGTANNPSAETTVGGSQ